MSQTFLLIMLAVETPLAFMAAFILIRRYWPKRAKFPDDTHYGPCDIDVPTPQRRLVFEEPDVVTVSFDELLELCREVLNETVFNTEVTAYIEPTMRSWRRFVTLASEALVNRPVTPAELASVLRITALELRDNMGGNGEDVAVLCDHLSRCDPDCQIYTFTLLHAMDAALMVANGSHEFQQLINERELNND